MVRATIVPHVSLPSPARMDETVPSDPRALVCPRCRASWPETAAPPVCTADGSSLVRARELAAADHDPMVGRTLEGRYPMPTALGRAVIAKTLVTIAHVENKLFTCIDDMTANGACGERTLAYLSQIVSLSEIEGEGHHLCAVRFDQRRNSRRCFQPA